MPETQIRLKLAENGRVVIPAHVRRELGVESGGEIILEKKDDRYYLTTRRQRIEDARRQIRRLQRLYVEEWVTVLSELSPHAAQAGLRAAVHAIFGLLNSTPHSASELPAEAVAELLHAMARAALTAAAP